MANILTVNYTHDFLDQMRCSVCKGYLSHSPIRLLPDGTCICGSCTPANMEVQVYRALHLEIFLQQLSFPCRFQERGCTENLLFNQATGHESKCIYRSFPCLSLTDCKWEGFSVSDCHNHFSEQHPELVKESADFKFKMNKDSNDVFITTKDKMVFVIKYLYKVQESCLKYDVSYFGNTGNNEGSYKVQLINNADADCNFSLKTSKCHIFDHSFYNTGNMNILKVNKYSEILDNPITVRMVLNLEVLESSGFCASQTVKVVDYELLETIKCSNCQQYLIPPLFDVNSRTICCICAKSSSDLPLSTNEDLIKLVSQINYPCQWRDCNFIGNSGNIRRHNLFCEYRLYPCRGLNCNKYISLATTVQHLRYHDNYKYSADGVYKYVLPNKSKTTFRCTIKNGILIVIEHSYVNNYCNEQTLNLLMDLCKCTVTVRFEHQHCNVKSKPFYLVSNDMQTFKFHELPSCFHITDELTLQIGDCVFEY